MSKACCCSGAVNYGSNVAVGQNAMQGNAVYYNASYNVAVGYGTLANLRTNNVCHNVAIGAWALGGHSTHILGNFNVGVGTSAGTYTQGNANVHVGHDSANQASCTLKHYSTFIGACAGAYDGYCKSTYIGYKSGYNSGSHCYTYIGSNEAVCACIYGAVAVSSISKGSGTFCIAHPDPSKTDKWDLQHSFAEAPTAGENIYRWQVTVSDCKHIINLPDYYRFLNKDDMIWVSPYRSFGAGYGEVTEDQKCLVLCTNQDGQYNVLLLGTRKDEIANKNWRNAETRRITL
jgi:hypothetical protein